MPPKLYTGIGDRGTTRLVTGDEVSKASQRIEAYGTVDELNALIGVVRDQIAAVHATMPSLPLGNVGDALWIIANELFDVGSELATPAGGSVVSAPVADAAIRRLETTIDAMTDQVPPLRHFVLPGGHSINSALHHARTVCRRAERAIVRLSADEPVRPNLIVYMNRLSDLLFVMSRFVLTALGLPEVRWQPASQYTPRPSNL